MRKLLFITKNRVNTYGHSVGLLNSARLTAESLNKIGIEAEAISVEDYNRIDRAIHEHKPGHVIIEALWVIPAKFKELIRLHPKVKWYVCVHSEIPFLANEGIALEWIYKYLREIDDERLQIAGNNRRLVRDLNTIGIACAFMPNVYPIHGVKRIKKRNVYHLDIGSFGAIRPLKNQLIQAMAAISYANKKKKALRFHINADRTEQNGQSVLKNIRFLFKNNPEHELVEHPWMTHEAFIEVLRHMDVGLQVSFSETFNITAADYVTAGIPVVVSNEINWLPCWTYASTNDMKSIKNAIGRSLLIRGMSFINRMFLKHYNRQMQKAWVKTLKKSEV